MGESEAVLQLIPHPTQIPSHRDPIPQGSHPIPPDLEQVVLVLEVFQGELEGVDLLQQEG